MQLQTSANKYVINDGEKQCKNQANHVTVFQQNYIKRGWRNDFWIKKNWSTQSIVQNKTKKFKIRKDEKLKHPTGRQSKLNYK